ncbi:Preprotein translocase subunit SECE1 [Acorus calamus]|uniref:Preprotein translocase subunit SECE1 n=1 Tax=Acorus calamus TaxID=4465 RepID=A0AAV9ETS6_ACOCL|nr:Preprotein translocase subunit SECE1 [Acorus calamus]
MALPSLTLRFPNPTPRILPNPPRIALHHHHLSNSPLHLRRRTTAPSRLICSSASPENGETPSKDPDTPSDSRVPEAPVPPPVAEEPEGLFGGVAEEIREIEWPAFGKVVGTTGVVLAVIAGSSVALLTVNAVLAELSDRVFVGKGIQDFF